MLSNATFTEGQNPPGVMAGLLHDCFFSNVGDQSKMYPWALDTLCCTDKVFIQSIHLGKVPISIAEWLGQWGLHGRSAEMTGLLWESPILMLFLHAPASVPLQGTLDTCPVPSLWGLRWEEQTDDLNTGGFKCKDEWSESTCGEQDLGNKGLVPGEQAKQKYHSNSTTLNGSTWGYVV